MIRTGADWRAAYAVQNIRLDEEGRAVKLGEAAPTQVISVIEGLAIPIDPTSYGYRKLVMLGWKPGELLGRGFWHGGSTFVTVALPVTQYVDREPLAIQKRTIAYVSRSTSSTSSAPFTRSQFPARWRRLTSSTSASSQPDSSMSACSMRSRGTRPSSAANWTYALSAPIATPSLSGASSRAVPCAATSTVGPARIVESITRWGHLLGQSH